MVMAQVPMAMAQVTMVRPHGHTPWELPYETLHWSGGNGVNV